MSSPEGGPGPEQLNHPVVRLLESLEITKDTVTCHLPENILPDGFERAYILISFEDDPAEHQIEIGADTLRSGHIKFDRPAEAFTFRLVIATNTLGPTEKLTVHPGAVEGSDFALAPAAFSFEQPAPER